MIASGYVLAAAAAPPVGNFGKGKPDVDCTAVAGWSSESDLLKMVGCLIPKEGLRW